jgi:polar amino acid transport system substrate-binding protein
LTKLLKGRVDLIIIDQYTAQHLLNTRLPEARPRLDFLKRPLAEKLIPLMFSRRIEGYEQKWRDFERGLKQIQEDGTLRQIQKKHGLD